MAISGAARKTHDELFPNHVSTLAVTDPELIEYFDIFAFDEVLRYGNLDANTRLMVQLAALIACQALSEYRVMLGAALSIGVTPIEVNEIVYQAVPYVGMAQVLDFLHATNECRQRHMHGQRRFTTALSGLAGRHGQDTGLAVGMPSCPVGVASMRDVHDRDNVLLVIDPVDHPVGSATGTVPVVERR